MELSAIELPTLYSIINKTFKIGKNKLIKFDFGLQDDDTFLNFKIVDNNLSSDYEKSTMLLTNQSLQHVIDIIESALADINLAGGFCMGDSKLDNKAKNFEIICEYFNLSHKKYLDCRLWRWINDIEKVPTKRGFRIDINEIEEVLQNLKDAKAHFKYWKSDVHRHINYGIHIIESVVKKDESFKFKFEDKSSNVEDNLSKKTCSINVLETIFSKSLSDVEEPTPGPSTSTLDDIFSKNLSDIEESTPAPSTSNKRKHEEEEDSDGFPTISQLKEIEFYDMLISFDKNVFIDSFIFYAIPSIELSTVFHFIIDNRMVNFNSVF